MAKLTLALAVVATLMAAMSLVLQLTQRDVAERIVFTHGASDYDPVDAKETRADCPRRSMLIGGGAAIQHGHSTPSVALYQGFPETGGWEVQAHETDPEDDPRFPWTLEAIAVCLRE